MERLHFVILALVFFLGSRSVNSRWFYVIVGAVLGILLWRFNAAASFIYGAIAMAVVAIPRFEDKPTRRPMAQFQLIGIGFVFITVWSWLAMWLAGRHTLFLEGLREGGIAADSHSVLLRWLFGVLILAIAGVHWRQLQRCESAKYVVSISYLVVAVLSLIINSAVPVSSSASFWAIALFAMGWSVRKHVHFNSTVFSVATPKSSDTEQISKYPVFVWGALAIIVWLAIDLRSETAVIDQLIWPDSTQYLRFADDIRELRFLESDYDLDQGFSTSRRLPPVYPALITLFGVLLGDPVIAGVCISFAMSIASIVLMFFIGRRLHSNIAGLLAAGFMAFNPFILKYATSVLTESTFTFLFVAGCYAAILAVERKSYWLTAVAGVSCALSFLTREIGLVCLAATLWGFFLYYVIVRRIGFGLFVKHVGICLVSFFLICLPHFVYVRAFTGHYGITSRMGSQQIGRSMVVFGGRRAPGPASDDSEDIVPRKVISESASSPLELASGLIHKVWLNGRAYLGSLLEIQGTYLNWAIIGGLIPIGFIHAVGLRAGLWRWSEMFSWGAAIVLGYAILSPFMVDTRYLYPLLPLLLLSAGLILAELGRILGRACSQPTMAVILPALAFFLVFDQLKPFVDMECKNVGPEALLLTNSAGHAEMGAEFLQLYPEYSGKRVVSRRGFGAYYLKASKAVRYPHTEELGELDADLLVADSHVLADYSPQFLELFSGCYQPAPGKIVYSRLFPKEKRVITVYDLQLAPGDELPAADDVPSLLEQGRDFLQGNDLWNASLACRAVLNREPENQDAKRLRRAIDQACREVTGLSWFCEDVE